MAKKDTSGIPFNPAILRWARTRLGFSAEEAGRAAGVEASRVEAWEKGADRPTVRQARRLAGLYERPFLEFFLNEVPTLLKNQAIPDYRIKAERTTPFEKRILEKIQSWAESIRLNALDLFTSNDEDIPTLTSPFFSSQSADPEEAASRARLELDVTIDLQIKIKKTEKYKFSELLRDRFERKGIITLKETELKNAGARGMALYFETLPIIIFSDGSSGGAAFTLCHELGHIATKSSAVSATLASSEYKKRADRVERWCDRFSGAFLMPKIEIEKLFTNEERNLDNISDSALTDLADAFCVSRHAMAVRLVHLNIINKHFYWNEARPKLLEEERNAKSFARPTYYGSRYRTKHGRLYTSLVIDALNSERISNHNAGEYLGIKNLNHLFDVRDRIG